MTRTLYTWYLKTSITHCYCSMTKNSASINTKEDTSQQYHRQFFFLDSWLCPVPHEWNKMTGNVHTYILNCEGFRFPELNIKIIFQSISVHCCGLYHARLLFIDHHHPIKGSSKTTVSCPKIWKQPSNIKSVLKLKANLQWFL